MDTKDIDSVVMRRQEAAFWYACGRQDGAKDGRDTNECVDFSKFYGDMAREYYEERAYSLTNPEQAWKQYQAAMLEAA